VFVTNNATKSRASFVDKFANLGVQVSEQHVFSGAYAAARYLKNAGFSRRVYCAGEAGLADELKRAGLNLVQEVSCH
jgi:ribonucleotide monophosphatase NagD (HAD superfamily)